MMLPSWPIDFLEFWDEWRKQVDEADKDYSNEAIVSLKVHER